MAIDGNYLWMRDNFLECRRTTTGFCVALNIYLELPSNGLLFIKSGLVFILDSDFFCVYPDLMMKIAVSFIPQFRMILLYFIVCIYKINKVQSFFNTELRHELLLSSVCLLACYYSSAWILLSAIMPLTTNNTQVHTKHRSNCKNAHVFRNLHNESIDWNRIGACE